MAATRDIVATYRGPGQVMQRLLAQGQREDRALIYLMVGCLLVFVGQTPALARQAFVSGQELNILLGGSLMALIFVMPLLLYALAAVIWLIARVCGSKVTGFGSRLVLFWAWLAAAPITLLRGLTLGFVGPGLEATLVEVVWLACFAWFWLAGFRAASADGAAEAA